MSGAVNYSIDIKASTATTWTNLSNSFTGTTANVTGLTASTTYDWRVRTNCSSSSSTYSQAQFTTTAGTGACPGIYDTSTNGTLSGAATIPYNTDVFGTIDLGSDRDYFRFAITNAGTATATLTNLPANYDLYILNSAGTTLAQSLNAGTTNESIARTYTAGTYYAYVRPRNNSSFNSTQCYTLKVQLGTASEANPGVEEENLDIQTSINIFPNPAQDRLNIYRIGPSEHNLHVYDLSGKIIYQQKLTEMLTTLDISSLATGVYMVKVSDMQDKEVTSQKIIKE